MRQLVAIRALVHGACSACGLRNLPRDLLLLCFQQCGLFLLPDLLNLSLCFLELRRCLRPDQTAGLLLDPPDLCRNRIPRHDRYAQVLVLS